MVIELQGEMEAHARSALKNLKDELNVDFISSGSPSPHITLESGFHGDSTSLERLLRDIAKQSNSFYINGKGLGVFVSKTPVVHIRWQLNERFLILKQILSNSLQGAFERHEITEFKKNIDWVAKTTLAFQDSSYENLYFILNTLQSNHFNMEMLIDGICLYEYSIEEGDQKLAFFPFAH